MCQKKSRFPFKVTGFFVFGSAGRWKLRCEAPTVVRQAAGSYAAWFDRLTNPTNPVP